MKQNDNFKLLRPYFGTWGLLSDFDLRTIDKPCD